jgi:hypothetical protein
MLSCAAPCDREGCDALQRRADDSAGTSAIAGVVASESDVIANGCQECGFSAADISVWPRQGSDITTEAVKQQTTGSAQAKTTAGNDGKYTLSLAPGDYWLCSGIACFATSVVAGHTTTLNIKVVYGASSGYVALPGNTTVELINSVERGPS